MQRIIIFLLGKGAKKNIKKLTNVSLFVCMSAENSKMLVFLCFFPNSSNLSTISMVAQEKKHKNVSFYGVCMYVRPKLTFVSFFLCFFLSHLSLTQRCEYVFDIEDTWSVFTPWESQPCQDIHSLCHPARQKSNGGNLE